MNPATKSAGVLLGKKCLVHECLCKKVSSSERSAASSNTMDRYESEITITIQARIRQPRKTDVTPAAETKNRQGREQHPSCFPSSYRGVVHTPFSSFWVPKFQKIFFLAS